MNDRHVLRFVNEVSSYLSLLNRHLADLDGVTDETVLSDHFEQIGALIDSQNNVLDSLNMYIETVQAELDYYNDAYRDLVARRREEGAEAINNDPYTTSILENYKRVPELEQVLKVFSDYRTTIDNTVNEWNNNKSYETLTSIVETTTNAFDDLNAARERYGYVAVDIKEEGQFRKVKVESQGRRVAVNVPVQQFNGNTVNRVIEGAMAASEQKNDNITSISLPDGEVIADRLSELSRKAVDRVAEMDRETFIHEEEPKLVPEETSTTPVVEEEPVKTESVAPEIVVAAAALNGEGTPEEEVKENTETPEVVVTPETPEETPEVVAEEVPEVVSEETVTPEPVAEEVPEVNPEEVAPETPSEEVPEETPETVVSEEVPPVVSEPIPLVPPVINPEGHDRSEDVAGDNIVTIGEEDIAPEVTPEEPISRTPERSEPRENKEPKKLGDKLKVVGSKASKLKNRPMLVSGLATLGFGIVGAPLLATVSAGFFMFYVGKKGVEKLKDFKPLNSFRQWAVSRKITKVVKEYDDLKFIIDENGPRIEDLSVVPPSASDEAAINGELAKALNDADANWKDIPGIYTRRDLEVPTYQRGSDCYSFGDKLKAFFGSEEIVGRHERTTDDDAEEVITSAEPVVETPPVVEAPVVPEVAPEPERAPEEPKKKKSFGDKLKGFFGIGVKVDEPEVVENPEPVVTPTSADEYTGVPVEEPEIMPVTGVMDREVIEPVTPVAPVETTAVPEAPVGRNYDDEYLMQAAKIINDAPDYDSVRDLIAGIFGGLVPGTGNSKNGFTQNDIDFLFKNVFDELKFQDLLEDLNRAGYIIEEPAKEIERGVSR